MKTSLAALVVIPLFVAAPAQAAAPHFSSSLGAVSSLCAFQSSLDYEPALLADFSKPTPEINSFAAEGLIVGLSGSKGALDEFVIFDQNRLNAFPINIAMSIDGGTYDFRGKSNELKIGQSPDPTSECDIVFEGQTFEFDLKTIDPQFIAFWEAKLTAMTGDAAANAKSLSKYISGHDQYWMLKD